MIGLKRRDALILSALCGSGIASAQTPSGRPTIKLRVGGSHPPESAPWIRLYKEVFIRDVKAGAERAGYAVEFTEAWGGTVVKQTESTAAVQGGILDSAYITLPAEASKLPLHNFHYWMPFGPGDPMQAYHATRAVYNQFPILRTIFEQRFNQRLLGVSTIQDQGLVSTFPVRSMDDFKGRKVGAIGPQSDYARLAGSAPVTPSMGELYMNLQTGVQSAHILLPASVVGLKLWEVAKYWTICNFGSICPHVLTINLDTWKALPPPIQKIISDAGDAWSEALAKDAKESEEADLRRWREGGGTVSTLSPELRAQWAALFPADYVAERAKRVDATGLPGTQVIAAYLANLRAAGYQPPRAWNMTGS